MASYEVMFGNLENYHIHMQGIARAMNLREDLISMGLNGLLHRIVLWIDQNAAFLMAQSCIYCRILLYRVRLCPNPIPDNFLAVREEH